MSYMKLPHNHHNEIDNTELLEHVSDFMSCHQIAHIS